MRTFFNRRMFRLLFLLLLLHLLFLQLVFVTRIASQAAESEIRALSGRTLRDRLQKNSKTIPLLDRRKALRVMTGIYIESMGNFQATDMSFDVDLYLYMHWRDSSLNHSSEEYVLVNDPKVRDKMWLPDLYFANARNSKFHDVTAPNFNLFIDKHGNIAYSIRITLNVACNLDLANYPMDRQTCGIRIISYAYVESQVNVTWFAHNSTRYNPEIGLPEFKIERLTPKYCDGTYHYAIMEHSYRIDKFSCLEAVIHLNRQIGYHLVQSFIPTALIVCISWVSFWIDRRAVPARVTLSFTTLLSLSTLGNGLRFGLPQVAYAKAIDFWFGSCMFFVFLSLVEFAAVNSYMREAEKYERLASYSAKKEMHLQDENSRWSPDESCAESSSLLIFGGAGATSDSNAGGGFAGGIGARMINLMSVAVPSLFLKRTKRKKVKSSSASGKHQHQQQQQKCSTVTNAMAAHKKASQCLLPCNGQIEASGTQHHAAMKSSISKSTPNGRAMHEMNNNNKKISLGLRLSERSMVELHTLNDGGGGDDSEQMTSPNNTPVPSPGNNNNNNFTPGADARRRNFVIPEIQPWPPSPFEKGAPPPAPRRIRKANISSSAPAGYGPPDRNPMATNHFLREGFRYSRKGLSIDRWSRILFPLTFTLWNLYYWIYYLWYIQTPVAY